MGDGLTPAVGMGFHGSRELAFLPKKRVYDPPSLRLNFPENFRSQKPPPLIFVGARRKISQDKKAVLALWITAPYGGARAVPVHRGQRATSPQGALAPHRAVPPPTTRDIALQLLVERALGKRDQKLLRLMTKRVGAPLRLQREKNVAQCEQGPGQYMLWKIKR